MKKLLSVATLVLGLTLASGTVNEANAQNKWSHKKKDAVIGGAAGAATGAVVSKKKGKGAIIGGVVGAGAGYVIGRHKDKKKAQK